MPALRISVGLVVKPLISGLAASVAMPFKSAPSAKIFTFNFSSDVMATRLLVCGIFQNDFCGLRKGFHREVRGFGPALGVIALDKNRPATGRLARRHVAP